jgi:uncharacterized protein
MEIRFLKPLRQRIAPDFGSESVAHDLGHLDRVWRNCQEIAAVEGGDLIVLAAASYLHDYHRVIERQQKTSVRPYDALGPVELILDELAEFPEELRPSVLSCISSTGRHSFSGDVLGRGLEERILHDADTLDAIGAVGIARAFMYGGMKQEPLWIPDSRFSLRYTPGSAVSVVHHFHEKLLRLPQDMETEMGRDLAARRHEFTVLYLEQLAMDLGIEAWR